MQAVGGFPTRNTPVRFGTKPAKTFPYEKYADLMTEVSVGGIESNDIAVVSLSHQDVPPWVLNAYRSLMKLGYRVSFAPIPESTRQAIEADKAVARKQEQMAFGLTKQYTHRITLKENPVVKRLPSGLKNFVFRYMPPNTSLQHLLRRKAHPGESIHLTVLTQDPDPLAEAVVKRIVQRKAVPFLLGRNRDTGEIQKHHALRDDQLGFVPPEKQWLYEHMTKLFSISNDGDEPGAKETSKLGEAELGRRKKLQTEANGKLSRIYMDRMGRIELGPRKPEQFFRTLGISPNPQIAKEFSMTLDDFGTFYKHITHLNKPETVSYFSRMNKIVGHYASQLQKFHRFHITRDDGQTDLTISIRDAGKQSSRYVAPSTITGNALPAEIFTSPVEDSVNGKVFLDIPFVLDERTFEGLHLEFKDGQVVDLSVDKGDTDHLKGMILGTGPKAHLKVPNFDRLGEFAIGFNRQITRLLQGQVVTNTLIAEKQDLHMALGNSYPITGGKNHCALHVDIPARSGPGSGLKIEGWADGQSEAMPIYGDGRFTDAFLGYQSDFDWKHYQDITWD